jgi:hypothetical protein
VEPRPNGIRDATKFLSRRKFISIKIEIYGDQEENLRGSRKNFTGIKEKFYGDQGRILRGSRRKFTGIEEEFYGNQSGK